MFIKKDLRKIPKILDDAIDCSTPSSHFNDDDDDDHEDHDTEVQNNAKRVKPTEPLKALKLARRSQEFQGSVKVLCEPPKLTSTSSSSKSSNSYVSKLRQLESLNLYDCGIEQLDGIGHVFHVQNTPYLHTMNLGRNPIWTIPSEFANITSLKHLWLDDCSNLTGSFPQPLLHLVNLETLRLPNCNITDLNIHLEEQGEASDEENNINDKAMSLDDDSDDDEANNDQEDGSSNENDNNKDKNKESNERGNEETDGTTVSDINNAVPTRTFVQPLSKLKILGLDRNQLTSLPSQLKQWAPNLEELYVRHNAIHSLDGIELPSTLKIVHLSSNQLETLDGLFTTVTTKTTSTDNKAVDDDEDGDVIMDTTGGDDDNDDDIDATSPATPATTKTQCPELTHLYVNGNQLRSVPDGILTQHNQLKRLVLAHNPTLTNLPIEIWNHVQEAEADDDGDDDNKNKKNNDCVVLWEPNPNVQRPSSSTS